MSLWEAIRAYSETGVQQHIEADCSPVSAARELKAVRDARFLLSVAEGYLVEVLADLVPHGRLEVDGVGCVEVRRSVRNPRYASEAILRLLIAQARDERRVDPETGEALEWDGDAIVRVLSECAPITTPSFSWRRGPLKKRLGSRFDEFYEAQGVKTTVVIS